MNPEKTKMVKYCMCCEKVIDIIEGYGERRPTSGICDDCLKKYYPEFAPQILELRKSPAFEKLIPET